MPRHIRLTRSLAIVRLQRQLEHDTYPRLQMGLIVALTGVAGWLLSVLLLALGMDQMALRYPAALVGGYLVFLGLLWLWLLTKAQDYELLPDMVDLALPRGGHCGAGEAPLPSGGGGDFAGGGASGHFETSTALPADEPGVLSSVGDAVGSVGDADELAIPLLAIALAIGLAFASLYVVYLAPALFAELLFDGVLSYTLYRRLRNTDSSHWLSTAFRRTVLPFALTAVFVALVGAGLAAYAPGAQTLGQALHAAG